MRCTLSQENELRQLIRETVRNHLTEGQKSKLEEDQRSNLAREIKKLQRQYGEEKAISAFLEDFNVGRIRTAIAQARQILQQEREDKRNKPAKFKR